MGAIKENLFRILPLKYQLPTWYYIQKFSGRMEPELAFIPKILPKSKTAVDIGANMGLYSMILSKYCKNVVAIEPNPQCLRILSAYGLPNVQVINLGVSDRIGKLILNIPVKNGRPFSGLASFKKANGEMQSMEVDVVTLDDLRIRNIGFVKIDVEGFEWEVLKGGRKTLLEQKPIVQIEVEQRHLEFPMQKIFSYLFEMGYRGFFLEKGKKTSIDEFSFEKHQEPFLKDVEQEMYSKTTGMYVNNFFFMV